MLRGVSLFIVDESYMVHVPVHAFDATYLETSPGPPREIKGPRAKS